MPPCVRGVSATLAERGSESLLKQVQDYAARENAPVVAISAAIEAQIADLSDEDKKVFLEDLGMSEPGLNRVIRAAYALLGLQTGADVLFLLVGAVLVFAMHGGFAFLEAGTVRHKNQVNALCKILVDFAISTVAYFLIGYTIAYGVAFLVSAPALSGGGSGYGRCAATFRSFDPDTGTYVGYDGVRRRCPYLG